MYIYMYITYITHIHMLTWLISFVSHLNCSLGRNLTNTILVFKLSALLNLIKVNTRKVIYMAKLPMYKKPGKIKESHSFRNRRVFLNVRHFGGLREWVHNLSFSFLSLICTIYSIGVHFSFPSRWFFFLL